MPPEWSGLLARSTVVIAAHPDDETIGLASLLPQMREVTIVHVTGGAPRNPADAHAAGFATTGEYAAARRRELLCALALAGISPSRTRELGIADQESALHLANIAQLVLEIISELRPASVFTHPYEGGHPDHDSAAFAVHAACRLAASPPAILEFASYHDREGAMETGCFLPGGPEAIEIRLSEEACRLKRSMYDCFASQQHMLVNFPIAVERFRPAPAYDFTAPAHAGTLLYERFDWGMTGTRFCALAREAVEALGLGMPV